MLEKHMHDVVPNCASSRYQPVAPLVNAPEPDMQPELIDHDFMYTQKFIIYAIICTNIITIRKSLRRDTQIYTIP